MDTGRFDHGSIDDVIHSRIRLAVLSVLVSFEEAEFNFLKEQVGTTDGNLATHLGKLREAGYVATDRRKVEGRWLSWYRMTPTGRRAFERYVERLSRLLDR